MHSFYELTCILDNRKPFILTTVDTIFGEREFADYLTAFQNMLKSKPDPQIFALGVKALGLLPCEVAVIGDSISKDMQPARQAGCKTIWYCGEQWTEEEIPNGMADRAIKDLNDLAHV